MTHEDNAAEPNGWEALDTLTADVDDEAQPEEGSEGPESTDAPASEDAPTSEDPPAAEADTPPEAPDLDGQDQPDDGSAADDAAPADAGPTTPDEQPKTVATKPFGFRVDRTDVAVEGAAETEDGWIVIPRAAWDKHIQPNLANRRAIREPDLRKQAQLEKQLEETRAQRSLAESQAAVMVELMEQLERLNEDQLYAWAEKTHAELPQRRAAAREKFYAQRIEQLEKGTKPTPEAIEEDRQTTLRGHIDRFAEDPRLAGVDKDRLFDRLWNDRRLYTKADQDYPEQNIRKGQEIVNSEIFFGVLEEAAAMQAARTAAPPAPKPAVANAQKRNEAALSGGRRTPPTTRAAGEPEGAGRRGPSTNMNEWDAKLEALKP